MAVKPILFSGPMVRALLDGRKTQTRRVLEPQPPECAGRILGPEMYEPAVVDRYGDLVPGKAVFGVYDDAGEWGAKVRFAPGDLLWVRETWQHAPQRYCSCPQGSEPEPCDDWHEGTGCRSNRGEVVYRADAERVACWRSPMFMPRGASRLTLAVTAVKVERLQDISEDDAFAEGVCSFVEGQDRPGSWEGITAETDRRQMVDVLYGSGRRAFMHLWETVNGADAWALNPWVVALTFTVHRSNVDAVLSQREAA